MIDVVVLMIGFIGACLLGYGVTGAVDMARKQTVQTDALLALTLKESRNERLCNLIRSAALAVAAAGVLTFGIKSGSSDCKCDMKPSCDCPFSNKVPLIINGPQR